MDRVGCGMGMMGGLEYEYIVEEKLKEKRE